MQQVPLHKALLQNFGHLVTFALFFNGLRLATRTKALTVESTFCRAVGDNPYPSLPSLL